jgi:hypothetical protein
MAEAESRSQGRLEDRQLGHLSAIERQLVALSAAASQQPELVVVQDADAGLGTVEMSWFSAVCHEIVDTTDTTIVLVGRRVNVDADQPGLEPQLAVVGAAEVAAGDENDSGAEVDAPTGAAPDPAPDADPDPAVRAEGGRA